MITILDNALLRLRELRDKHNKKFVRLQVKYTKELNYDWSFSNEETRNDVIVDDILIIDRINELYLTNMQLDYTYDDFESVVKNRPNHHAVVVHLFYINIHDRLLN